MAYGSGGYSRGGSGGGFRGGGGGFRRFNNGPRTMHKIKCSQCGKDDEVPFKPIGDKPVYCKDCYFKSKGITPREPREAREPRKEEKAEKAEEEAEVGEEVEEEIAEEE